MDGASRSWFGFPLRALPAALRAQNIGPVPLDHSGWRADRSDASLTDAQVEGLLRYPLCIDLEVTPWELARLSPEVVAPARECHLASIRAHTAHIARALDVARPGALSIIQGYDPFNAVARELAMERGLPVLALENTSLSDRMLWDDHSALTTNRNLAKNFYWRHESAANPAVAEAYCSQLIAETKQRKQDEHTSPELAYAASGPARPTVLFLGQVYTDSSVIFGIGPWQTPIRLMRELARLAEAMDFNLWIKLHPKEISGSSPIVPRPYHKLTFRKLAADPEFQSLSADGGRVMIDHENTYDTYDLISKSDAVVTLNSQAGMEAAIRGVPAVVAGQALYGGLGFTLDADCPEVLAVQLNRALGMDQQSKKELQSAAQIFTHIYFERYCIRKSPDAVARLIAQRCFGAS